MLNDQFDKLLYTKLFGAITAGCGQKATGTCGSPGRGEAVLPLRAAVKVIALISATKRRSSAANCLLSLPSAAFLVGSIAEELSPIPCASCCIRNGRRWRQTSRDSAHDVHGGARCEQSLEKR